ncbi:hypothetical protein V9T40_014326 [Parthenolecanium corni]|uniref:Uncharacterized protein n=1 Tax=Parthenolecanium corni TaxID=536013 RepID=A0AAN9T327_9HEMI
MRLCYQIFERKVIQVPLVVEKEISDAYAPPKNDFVTDSSSSSLNNSSESSKMEDKQPLTSTLDSPSKNLKRKCDSLSEIESSCSGNKDFMRGLELKIPRISVDVLPRSDESKGEVKMLDSCTSLYSESSLKAPIKTPSNDSGTYSDDCVKYEEDIEEVDDDDDDEDRLRISQLSDEEMPLDEKIEVAPVKEQLIVDTSTGDKDKPDEELQKEREDKKAAKYRRKNKKSKHHHHRRHHHRHHDRKKLAPQATILHSPDTDIMKLKVKLNTMVPTTDTKHHKQSRRKRRRSPEPYFSSSSPSSRASSVTASSPDHVNSVSRIDEDSLHSHISEMSTESVDTTTSSKEDPPKVSEVAPSPSSAPAQSPPTKVEIPNELPQEQSSLGTKEKLLQMRAFRPKNIAVVKPEESEKNISPVDPVKMTAGLKNDSNNNKHDTVPKQIIDKPSSTAILRPATSSSITVSKITAAEKILMEQEKRMNVANEERPSLEITLVSEPAKSSGASSPSTTYSDSVSTTAVKAKPIVPRTMKPLPALVQLPAAKSATKSVSIFPCSKQVQQQRSDKPSLNTDAVKKVNETLPIVKSDGMKQSVTISLSGNHFGNDLLPGALDLSGKQCGGKIIDKAAMSKNAAAIAAAQVNLMQQHAKKAYVQPYGAASSQPQLASTSLSYNPVTNMASLAESRRLAQTLASKEAAVQFQYMFGSGGGLPFAVMQSPKHFSHANHRIYAPSPHTSPNAQVINLPLSATSNSMKTGKVSGMPALNEIKIGPVSSTGEATPQHKPGPNQNIRNIPNPSRLLRRQQPVGSVGPMMAGTVNSTANKCTTNGGVPLINCRLPSTLNSFTNHKKNGEKVLQTVVPKGYLDHPSIKATK